MTDEKLQLIADQIDAPWLSGGSSRSTDGSTYGDFLEYDNACAALFQPLITSLNRAQTTGLNCLIFLSLREQTTVAYQKKEWGFDDIPEQIITWCDSLEENDLIELATDIAIGLLEEIIGAAVEPTSAQIIAMQAIEAKINTPLLSDY
ncbi:hypothetical protein [Nostoc sp.]|uniref:hypothetical protein n=1 Tax=Nostoc sp. TaxID=1180 RepID=UPI002FFCCFD4